MTWPLAAACLCSAWSLERMFRGQLGQAAIGAFCGAALIVVVVASG